MSERGDLIFGLPTMPRTAVVRVESDSWAQALEAIGCEVRAEPSELAAEPDLAVVPPAELAPLLEAGVAAAIVEGSVPRRLRRRHPAYAFRRLLAVPDLVDPEAFFPVADLGATRYLLKRSPPPSVLKLVRNLLAPIGLSLGLARRRGGRVTLATRGPSAPFLVAAAELGAGEDPRWVLLPAQGDALSRGSIQVLPPGARAPEWVVKFPRVRGYREAVDSDERSLALLVGCSDRVRRHAPRVLRSLRSGELLASAETAAVGQPLVAALASWAPRRWKLAAIEAVAAWIVRLGLETRDPAPGPVAGNGPSAGRELPPGVPGVLTHNDLGGWNVIVDLDRRSPQQFTVLDWEGALRPGPPLWDLVYFLLHALAQLDGATGLGREQLGERERHAAHLLRGELESSAVLFTWIRRYVEALSLTREMVPELVTTMMVDHGAAEDDRQETIADADARGDALATLAPRLTRLWFSDPELGERWRRWKAGGS